MTKLNTKKSTRIWWNNAKKEDQFRSSEIINARNSFNAAINILTKCQTSLKAAKQNLPNLEKAKNDYETELAKKTKERNHQHTLYLERAKDRKDVISFLDEFSKVLNDNLAKYPTSFADLSEKLLRHTSKIGLATESLPILAALNQDPSEYDNVPTAHSDFKYVPQGKIMGNIKNLVVNLKNRLIADSHQNNLNEQNAANLFTKFKIGMDKIISSLSNDIQRTNSQISKMKECAANETAIITSATSKLARNENLQNSARLTCIDFAAEFVSATKNRFEEIGTVNTIITICAKRFGELPEELVTYLKNVQNKFKEYTNSTTFHNYVKYVQHHLKDSAAGRKLSGNSQSETPPTIYIKWIN